MLMMYRSAVPLNNNYRMFLIVNHLSQSQPGTTTFCWAVEGIIWIAIHLHAKRWEGAGARRPREHLSVGVGRVLAQISDRGRARCPAGCSEVLAVLLDGTRTFCRGQNRLGFTTTMKHHHQKKKPKQNTKQPLLWKSSKAKWPITMSKVHWILLILSENWRKKGCDAQNRKIGTPQKALVSTFSAGRLISIVIRVCFVKTRNLFQLFLSNTCK